MKVPPKRKGNLIFAPLTSTASRPSMKVPPKRKGNGCIQTRILPDELPLNESPSEKEGKFCERGSESLHNLTLNESPSEKEGKSVSYAQVRFFGMRPSMKVPPKRKGNHGHAVECSMLGRPSMKVPPKRKGNSYPKIARNHAAETGASREPRGGYTQNYTLQPHLPPHNSLAREETMRATRHVPVTYQVLAHTKTPAGCFLSDPARVFTYERGWRGSGKPD